MCNMEFIIAGAIVSALLGYLAYALFNPEKFS
jgi:K+-transporting ATPase KdpF subunit